MTIKCLNSVALSLSPTVYPTINCDDSIAYKEYFDARCYRLVVYFSSDVHRYSNHICVFHRIRQLFFQFKCRQIFLNDFLKQFQKVINQLYFLHTMKRDTTFSCTIKCSIEQTTFYCIYVFAIVEK
jgi:hypothetical protein